MEVTIESLKFRYRKEETDALLDLHSSGTLTDDGYAAIECVLNERGAKAPDRPKTHDFKIKNSRPSKYLIMLFLLMAFIAWSIYEGYGREERINQTLDEMLGELKKDRLETMLLELKKGNQLDGPDFLLVAEDLINEASHGLPKTIDDFTILESMEIDNEVLVYNLTLKSSELQVTSDIFQATKRKELLPFFCNNTFTSLFFSHNVDIVYHYTLDDGTHFADVSLTNNDCVTQESSAKEY